MSVIKDGLKLPANKNGRVEIPNCQRNQLPSFFVEMGFKKGVEIGTYRGNFAIRLAKEGLEIHTIDPYLYHYEYYPSRIRNQRLQDKTHKLAKSKLKHFPNAHIIRKTSMEAVKDFEDESLDFVYIDGHHGFKWVAEDIFEWSKKVRKSGIISGHDYADIAERRAILQVKHVVDAYTLAFNIRPWYVLGRQKVIPNEVSERDRTWMWFKDNVYSKAVW
jgi:hypothetical protein